MEPGRQHLWDFDNSPENKLATVKAGPPIKKNNKSPKNASRTKKGGGRSQAEAVEETSEDVPEIFAEPIGEMVWWEYGLGPQVNVDKSASGKRGKGRKMTQYQQLEETNQDESDCSDDGYESNNEHVPGEEPGN